MSEKYLTSGGIDIDELLRQQQDVKGNVEFLGKTTGGLGLE